MKNVLCLSIALGVEVLLGSPAGWASGTVTNCTEVALRTALLGGGSVIITCDSVIPLSSAIIVTKDITLDGTGHTAGLSGLGTTNTGRLFYVQPGSSLTLRGLALSGGNVVGSNGTNGAAGFPGRGAGIYNDHGVVLLDGCTVTGHSVGGGAGSAAVKGGVNGGDGGAAAGAALFNDGGQVTVTNSVFSGNRASGGTGGAGGGASGLGNGNDGGDGGNGGLAGGAALSNTGNGLITIWNSLFASNQVAGGVAGVGGASGGILGFPGDSGDSGVTVGGGIYSDSGKLTIINSTFLSNTGTGANGNAGLAGTGTLTAQDGFSGGPVFGGGIFGGGGILALTNCTFVANSLTGGVGGIGGSGSPRVFGGDGGTGGAGGDAVGGGLYVGAAPTLIVNCTFSDNAVKGGTPGVGGAGSGLGDVGDVGNFGISAGAAVYSEGNSVHLRNSILANSALGGNVAGGIYDEGFNLSSDATLVVTAQGSRRSVDPGLESLVTPSGVVPVLTLASDSPAVDAITAADGNGCPGFDARNALRVAPFDIGAYELNGTFDAPSVQASLQSNQVILAWPASSSFVLQTTPALTGANAWSAVTNQASIVGSTRRISIPPTGQAQFFQLRK